MTAEAPMTFDRFGRTLHLWLRDADELKRVLELDEAHWVATSVPISTLQGDSTFLSLVDTDQNGRIRVVELKRAITWRFLQLRNASGLAEQRTGLKLDSINTDVNSGQHIHQSIQRMLNSLNRKADELSLEDLRKIKSRIESLPVSEPVWYSPKRRAIRTCNSFSRMS